MTMPKLCVCSPQSDEPDPDCPRCSPTYNDELTYDDAIEILLTCTECKQVHEMHVLQEANPRQVSWADPNDGHAYRSPFQPAGEFLRSVKQRAQEIKNERASTPAG